MNAAKADIIKNLRQEIFRLQGIKSSTAICEDSLGLGPINKAFPGQRFPLAAVHEFLYSKQENAASTAGFLAALLAGIAQGRGILIWIAAARHIFPPALKSFGIAPEQVIFINLKKDKEILWAMEEALKCAGLAAVIGEMQELDFTATRRLQLAVEKSKVTGFVLRNNPRQMNTTACFSRWQITPLPALVLDGLPGVGFPSWQVQLLKMRNGKPGTWQLSYVNGRFRHQSRLAAIQATSQAKTG